MYPTESEKPRARMQQVNATPTFPIGSYCSVGGMYVPKKEHRLGRSRRKKEKRTRQFKDGVLCSIAWIFLVLFLAVVFLLQDDWGSVQLPKSKKLKIFNTLKTSRTNDVSNVQFKSSNQAAERRESNDNIEQNRFRHSRQGHIETNIKPEVPTENTSKSTSESTSAFTGSLRSLYEASTQMGEIPKSMMRSKIKKIPLARDGLFYQTVRTNFPTSVTNCLTHQMGDDMRERISFEPNFHEELLVDSIRSNNREQYKQLISKPGTVIKQSLLDPYQLRQPPLKVDPPPGICIFKNAYVDADGNVCTQNICLQSKSCSSRYGNRQRMKSYRTAKAIFVIGQNQGYGYWHYLMENWIRLFVALDFLRAETTIKIHVIGATLRFVKESISFLGLSPSRLVTGSIVSAVALFPESIWCGSPPYSLVSNARRQILDILHFPKKYKQILVIKREGGRSVVNHKQLTVALSKQFPQFHVNTFSHMPFKNAMKIFSTSDLIAAPHVRLPLLARSKYILH